MDKHIDDVIYFIGKFSDALDAFAALVDRGAPAGDIAMAKAKMLKASDSLSLAEEAYEKSVHVFQINIPPDILKRIEGRFDKSDFDGIINT